MRVVDRAHSITAGLKPSMLKPPGIKYTRMSRINITHRRIGRISGFARGQSFFARGMHTFVGVRYRPDDNSPHHGRMVARKGSRPFQRQLIRRFQMAHDLKNIGTKRACWPDRSDSLPALVPPPRNTAPCIPAKISPSESACAREVQCGI